MKVRALYTLHNFFYEVLSESGEENDVVIRIYRYWPFLDVFIAFMLSARLILIGGIS